MNLGLLKFFFIILFYSSPVWSEPIQKEYANFKLLDKISNKLVEKSIKVNESDFIETLNIQVFSCFTEPPNEIPEDYVLVDVKDNYKDETFRNLLTWNSTSKKWNNTIKGAHIFEKYQYYPNRENVLYFEGKSNTIIGDYQLEYNINEKIMVSSILNLTHIKAEGSNIGDESRNTLAAIFIWKQLVSDQLSYNINIRQEFFNDFENPLIVSVDTKYKINQWYSLKANASKNYRVPTFNDLYWNSGGNVDLKPEISYQGAISNEFYFKNFLLIFITNSFC